MQSAELSIMPLYPSSSLTFLHLSPIKSLERCSDFAAANEFCSSQCSHTFINLHTECRHANLKITCVNVALTQHASQSII